MPARAPAASAAECNERQVDAFSSRHGSEIEMKDCKHLSRVDFDKCRTTLAQPDMWNCHKCETSDRIRMCLCCGTCFCSSCSVHHFDHKHPLMIRLNSENHTVHCSICDHNVGNDNRRADVKNLRLIAQSVQSLRVKKTQVRTRMTGAAMTARRAKALHF
jgi:uncharacterized UBP type Zn finger protein